MAWTLKTVKDMLYATETSTLPSGAVIGYSSEIDFIRMGPYGGLRFVRFALNATAVSGSNLDVALYGAYKSGGTKVEVLNPLVSDITATGEVASSTALDMFLYPFPFYYVGWLADADESANSITVTLTAASAAPAMG